MNSFTTSLLREKFLIFDSSLPTGAYEPVKALSNRMRIDLGDEKRGYDSYVIRAHNMHTAVRLAARIFKAYEDDHTLGNKPDQLLDWEDAWYLIINDFERSFNPSRWISVYHDGKIVFEKGERNALLDVIEQCDNNNTQHYDLAIPKAEYFFRDAGKSVKIDHDANVALSITVEKKNARTGIIMRGPNTSNTFSFTVRKPENKPISIPHLLTVAACFLEGVQLAFIFGMNSEKIALGVIDRFTPEEKQTKEAGKRLGRLRTEIASLEDTYHVRYRPDKPSFKKLTKDAEAMARRMFGARASDKGDAATLPIRPRSRSAQNPDKGL